MGSNAITWFAALALFFVVGPSFADEGATVRRSARLQYEPDPTARCGDEQSLRDTVAAQLGYDPFVESSPTILSVRINRAGPGLRAEIELRDDTGSVLGRRVLESAGDCVELGATLGLALALAIDPLAGSRPAAQVSSPPPAPVPPPPIVSSAPPSAPPVVRAPPRAPAAAVHATPAVGRTLQIGGGLLYQVGAVPSSGFGLDAAIALAWPTIVGAVGGRLDLPTSQSVTGGEVSAFRLLLSVAACRPFGPLALCALVRAGIVRVADEGFFPERHVSHATMDAGARASFALSIGRAVSIRPWLEATGVLVRPRHERDGRTLWQAEPVVVSGGLAVVWSAS